MENGRRILRHKALELCLDMRSDGYVRVQDLLKLNLRTFANIPLRLHTIDDIREAVRKDNKQRFGLLEENGELLIKANQGHSLTVSFMKGMTFLNKTGLTVEKESLLKPIISVEEVPRTQENPNVKIFKNNSPDPKLANLWAKLYDDNCANGWDNVSPSMDLQINMNVSLEEGDTKYGEGNDETIEGNVNNIENIIDLEFTYGLQRGRVTIVEKVCIFVYTLAKGLSNRDLGECFQRPDDMLFKELEQDPDYIPLNELSDEDDNATNHRSSSERSKEMMKIRNVITAQLWRMH
ncbi:hypothetical protein Sjap_020531 [Stephania japonica]|uniref:2'-phosphotransferase n=1 Tax=Stephania japonica TaxID=461633 RepID=A0AAP0F6E3_9MAGN